VSHCPPLCELHGTVCVSHCPPLCELHGTVCVSYWLLSSSLCSLWYEFFRSFDFYILSPCFFRVKRPPRVRRWPSPHRPTTPALSELINNTLQQL
jgi:hypothetical protein